MVFKQMLELYDILDDINADGRRVEEYLRSCLLYTSRAYSLRKPMLSKLRRSG